MNSDRPTYPAQTSRIARASLARRVVASKLGITQLRIENYSSHASAANLRDLAHLIPGESLGEPPRGGQRAEVGRIERWVPFGEVDDPHPRIGRELAHRPE